MSFIFVAAMVESSKGLSSQELTIFYFCLPIIHTVLDVFLERYVYFKSIIERYQVFLLDWRINVKWYKWDIQILQSSIKVQYIDLKNKPMSWYMNEKLGTFARKKMNVFGFACLRSIRLYCSHMCRNMFCPFSHVLQIRSYSVIHIVYYNLIIFCTPDHEDPYHLSCITTLWWKLKTGKY